MQFEVTKVTPTKNGNFRHVLQHKTSVETPLGPMESQITFAMFTKKQNDIGLKVDINPEDYEVVSKDHVISEGPDAGKTISLKYLYPKRA